MENLQLYRTSPLMGGQMKWDLVLGNVDGNLVVKNFHLTPISDNVPYNRYSQDSLLNYTHQSNVKDFYKETESSFYSEFLEPNLSHKYPIIEKPGTYVKNFDDTFLAGCKRARYQLYNKQYEFLVPLWIEKCSESFEFDIIVKLDNTDLYSKRLNLTGGNDPHHNKFCQYLISYFKYMGQDLGSQDVMNINLTNKIAYLDGLNVKNGQREVRNVSKLVNNLLLRERPLMESDSLITNCFRDNHMIMKQLFNFNLCFNLEDILPHQLYSLIKLDNNGRFGITIKTYIDGEELELKDIYTNSEYIPGYTYFENDYYELDSDYNLVKSQDSQYLDKPNVLDYLRDYSCTDLIYKNKINQSIPHWQLVDNSDYIFNVYDGFAGVFINSSGEREYNRHMYGSTPDTLINNYSPISNSTNWVNICKVDFNSFNYIYNNFGFDNDIVSVLNGYCNGLYYTSDNVVKVLAAYVPKEDDYQNIAWWLLNDVIKTPDNIYKHYLNISKDNDIIVFIPEGEDNNYYIITKNIEKLVFNKVLNDVEKFLHWTQPDTGDSDQDVKEHEYKDRIEPLFSSLSSLKYPSTVTFHNSLDIVKADGPSMGSKEIYYSKKENTYNYVFRYDGLIKPCFIGKDSHRCNNIYYKLKDNDSNFSKFKNFINSKFAPEYPSIGYYSLLYDRLNYDSLNDGISNIKQHHPEHKWFYTGENIILNTYISWTEELTGTDAFDKSAIKRVVIEKLNKLYGYDLQHIEYIYNLYNITFNVLESFIDNNHMTYRCDIILELK